MKEKLQALLEAIINGDSEAASKHLKDYLTSKSRSILSEDKNDEAVSADIDELEGDVSKTKRDQEKDVAEEGDEGEDEGLEDEDEMSEEQQEKLARKGRRTDKASKSRTKK